MLRFVLTRPLLPIDFPPPPGERASPVWTGSGFDIGGSQSRVLAYDIGDSGWTDDLTSFHEETAGDGHYIDRASRRHAIRSLLRFLPARNGVVMDIGCSSGFMLPLLKESLPDATVIGADYVRGPLEQLAKRLPSTPLIQFNLVKCPLPSASVDGALLLNVLEHIEEDVAAMHQLARILKPGGVAVIEAPAGPHLYDIYDKQLMHFRRYKIGDLIAKLKLAKFEIVERSHLGFFLYPAFWATKRRGQLLAKKTDKEHQKIVANRIQAGMSNPLLHGLMRVEESLRSTFYYPAGIRCLVTCKKPASVGY
jgi:SAM-dependent methyltransferase